MAVRAEFNGVQFKELSSIAWAYVDKIEAEAYTVDDAYRMVDEIYHECQRTIEENIDFHPVGNQWA
jgi:hypothetical protein